MQVPVDIRYGRDVAHFEEFGFYVAFGDVVVEREGARDACSEQVGVAGFSYDLVGDASGVDDCVSGELSREDETDRFWVSFHDVCEELVSCHAGHHHVGADDIKRAVLFHEFKCFSAAGGEGDVPAIAHGVQDAPESVQDILLIVYK